MIGIVDYGAGNIRSVEKAVRFLGETPVLSNDAQRLLKADKVILPGVGNFGAAMENLKKLGLKEPLREIAKRGTPFLGICLGLQLLFESSEESVNVRGLNILPGKIVRIPKKDGLKIPHMGWNSLTVSKNSRILGHLDNPYVYFVHSYYLKAGDENIVSAKTNYGVEIHAAVESGNIFATQFHPEKSSDTGLSVLEKFLRL